MNHNNKPFGHHINQTFEIYLTAITHGKKWGQKKLTFNFIYEYLTPSPVFVEPMETNIFSLEIDELSQKMGLDDPILIYNLPDLKDPEGNEIFIDAYFEEAWPCGCVKFNYEKLDNGTYSRIWLEIDQTRITDFD